MSRKERVGKKGKSRQKKEIRSKDIGNRSKGKAKTSCYKNVSTRILQPLWPSLLPAAGKSSATRNRLLPDCWPGGCLTPWKG